MEQSKTQKDATFYTIDNGHGFEVTLCDIGASIYEIKLNGKPMTIAPKDHAVFLTTPSCYGKTVGRINGRIPNAEIVWQGHAYQLPKNEGSCCLHSNLEFTLASWETVLKETQDAYEAIMTYHSSEEASHLPGEVDVTVTYSIDKQKPILTIRYEATSDKYTPLALTNHSYFNFGGKRNVIEDCLAIRSTKMEELNSDLVPTGKMIEASSVYDFSKPKQIGKDLNSAISLHKRANGYDHIWIFDKDDGPKLTLENEGYSLHIYTDFNASVLYSSNYPNEGLILNAGHKDECQSGIAIEPCEIPLDFANGSVSPAKKYERFIRYEFKCKDFN